ncbi:hypothetical protein F511_12965 [Dorcoceras hygrometricum]|uniref:Uncharacterized protein n=1 Tax=Dorcoceras hygrometricum TaxID=472368 RepID=A0A2Z7ALY3_9LAMI|nr:hypothetical protein F511_12965 [Dorcoceras hygrometricum]
MAASLSINAMQVDFASVLAIEHARMVRMFTSLEETWIKGFLEVSSSVFEGAVIELFDNANVIGVTIVSFVANRKMVITKNVFTEAFGLPAQIVVEMRMRSSGTDVPFKAPNKKKEMKVECQLLHDIVAKALCAKAGSFDAVTSEKFDLMVDISASLKVNWGHILFQTLVAMVHTPTKQSQGLAVQLSVLLERLVKADLGEFVKLHLLKVLNNRSVHTYMKKNLGVGPAGETKKVSGVTTSEKQFTTVSLQSLTNKPEKEAGETTKPEKAAVEKKNKKKEKVVPVVKKQVVVVKKLVEARSQAAAAKSKSGTSSGADSCPLAKLGATKKGQAAPKQKKVVDSSDLESTVSLHLVKIMKKQKTQRTRLAQRTAGDQAGFNHGPFPDILAGANDASIAGGLEYNMDTTTEMEGQADNASTAADQEEHVECTEKMEIEAVNNEHAIVVRYGPAQPAQQPITSAGKGICSPVEIREFNWTTHYLPKIDPTAKGKEILEDFSQPNPVEEHCLLVLKSAWEDVSSKMCEYDKWVHFHTVVSELFERRMLVLYKLYEMEIKKRVDEHCAKFNLAERSVNYDYMCIRFLNHELKEIVKQHRAQTAEKQPAQPEGRVEEIVWIVEDVEETEAMNSHEHQAQENEKQAQNEPDQEAEQEAPTESKITSIDSKAVSLDSKVDRRMDAQTFMKLDFGLYKRSFYEKMDTMVANVTSS